MTPLLKDFFATHSPLVRAEIEQYFARRRREDIELGSQYLRSVEHLAEFSLRGGKGIRGLLVVLGYRAAGGKSSEIYKVAAGIELFHKHLLNLDDMADRDELRNGGPTLWKKYQADFFDWGDTAHHARTFSEIDGTLLGSYAFELVRSAQFPAETLLAVIGEMNRVMYWRTVAGWQIHYLQNHQSLAEVNEAEFLRGLELVTAEYTFVAPLTIGALLAGGSHAELVEAFTQYGREVGTAFQLQDDILGLFGDSDEMGKPVGNDVREGKKTVLLQRAFHAVNKDDQLFLMDVCGRALSDSELERVRALVRNSGALTATQRMATEAAARGVAALKGIDAREAVELLTALADFVVTREK